MFEPLNVLGFICLFFLALVIIREFWAWYFKINRVISLLEKIEANTRSMYVEGDLVQVTKENEKAENEDKSK